jgi:predicted DNA-binding transcriptional regulator AlpA
MKNELKAQIKRATTATALVQAKLGHIPAAAAKVKGSAIPAALANFDSLPDSAHVRLPVVAAWRSSSPATVWRHVKAGLLPAPVKLGPNTTAWRVGDLRRAMGEVAA